MVFFLIVLIVIAYFIFQGIGKISKLLENQAKSRERMIDTLLEIKDKLDEMFTDTSDLC